MASHNRLRSNGDERLQGETVLVANSNQIVQRNLATGLVAVLLGARSRVDTSARTEQLQGKYPRD